MAVTYIILLLFWATSTCIAQKKNTHIPDSLYNKEYTYLDEQIDIFKRNPSKAAVYVHSYLAKAKAEKNWKEMVLGYKNYFLLKSDENYKLVYADSMIYAAKNSKDNVLIGSAYLSKGIVYYAEKEHKAALDNYIIANNFITKTSDPYLFYKLKYNMALIKYYLGSYDEAIVLLKKCIDHFKDNDDRAYLNSLHSLGLVNNRLGNYGLCSEINNTGVTQGKRRNNTEVEPYFIHSEGVNQYGKKNYAMAIRTIQKGLIGIRKNKDFSNESVGYYYIGKSYWELRKTDQAIHYFRKVDKSFDDKGYIRPDLREMYEVLIDYYVAKKNPEEELYYVNKLLKVDSISNSTYKYLTGKMHKEYDTKKLFAEKKKLENSFNRKKSTELIFISVIGLLILSSSYLVYRNTRIKKNYKKKFAELMFKNENTKDNVVQNKIPSDTLNINPDTVAGILKQLEKFEQDKKFLEQDWTLVKLAAAFDSNTKYLSKIIYFYRDKKFVEYINDLKIDYLVELLKTNRIVRKFSNAALAEEAGFSSTQRFTNAFLQRIEISPTFFIKELEKQQL
ncbi:tetratricopeptide repeat protein [Flavobacterium sp. EDS]|uniref:tetratricopeptide repeat protein n=1 Tax=Flavobacterium sp. EDS TaxID=2897328 RepID=UPI001E4473D9|nr:tetratricopeptide repeat protein [Flavobacterium sp. EDS]MCD0474054.1 tetratricopeptide repeat protein [Flavobacterium sp. EDS]